MAIETDWQVVHSATKPRAVETLTSEAELMRSSIGGTRTGFAAANLKCARGLCVPVKSGETVIVVNEPTIKGDSGQVLVSVYMPTDQPGEYDGRIALAIVSVKDSGNGNWVGAGYVQPVRLVPVRLGK